MVEIYIYDGEFSRGEAGYSLIQRGAMLFAQKYGIDLEEIPQIAKYDKGKPYFTNCDIKFSLSHSGSMWMCAYSDSECGLDIQEIKEDVKWEKITERHYKTNEKAYVNLWGLDGFYSVWSAKEAYGKMTGVGFFDDMPEMADDNHDLIKNIVYNEKKFNMLEIDIHPEIKCFICTQDKSYSVSVLV